MKYWGRLISDKGLEGNPMTPRTNKAKLDSKVVRTG